MSEPYEPEVALATIRSILLNDGYLLIRDHCYKRMEKRNVDDVDIRVVLEESGTIRSNAVWDKDHKKWKYAVDGYDTENEKFRVVVNIIETNWRVVAISVVGDWKE